MSQHPLRPPGVPGPPGIPPGSWANRPGAPSPFRPASPYSPSPPPLHHPHPLQHPHNRSRGPHPHPMSPLTYNPMMHPMSPVPMGMPISPGMSPIFGCPPSPAYIQCPRPRWPSPLPPGAIPRPYLPPQVSFFSSEIAVLHFIYFF